MKESFPSPNTNGQPETVLTPQEEQIKQLETKLADAERRLEISEKKGVPVDKLKRDRTEMRVETEDGGVRIETTERPPLEKMRLDVLAGLQTVKNVLGVSDFAKAFDEVERLERRLEEIQE